MNVLQRTRNSLNLRLNFYTPYFFLCDFLRLENRMIGAGYVFEVYVREASIVASFCVINWDYFKPHLNLFIQIKLVWYRFISLNILLIGVYWLHFLTDYSYLQKYERNIKPYTEYIYVIKCYACLLAINKLPIQIYNTLVT